MSPHNVTCTHTHSLEEFNEKNVSPMYLYPICLDTVVSLYPMEGSISKSIDNKMRGVIHLSY